MKIETFEGGPFLENTYLLAKESEALIIDPGFFTEEEYQNFSEKIKEYNVNPIAIVLTHAHVDHILGLHRVLKEFKLPVYLSAKDLFLWENFGQQATMFGLRQVGFSFKPKSLPNSGFFSIGLFEFECLYTPGHSPDHTAFYFKEQEFCISGDALFNESIGRTDLYKGNFDLLIKSIREKLYSLPDDTIIYPGHGPDTTVLHEKKNNPFVKG